MFHSCCGTHGYQTNAYSSTLTTWQLYESLTNWHLSQQGLWTLSENLFSSLCNITSQLKPNTSQQNSTKSWQYFSFTVGKVSQPGSRGRDVAHTAPPADMGNLIAESKRLINSSLSQNTYKAYQPALNKFQLFLNNYGLQPTWPLHSNILLYFIAYLSIQIMSPNSVSLYISALSYFHKVNHLPEPTKSFQITRKHFKA